MKNFKVYTPEEIEVKEPTLQEGMVTTYLSGDTKEEREFAEWQIKSLGYNKIEQNCYATSEEIDRMKKFDFLYDRSDLKEQGVMLIPPLTLSNEEFAILFLIANGDIEPGYFFGPLSYLTKETNDFYLESSLPESCNDVLQYLRLLEEKEYLKMQNVYGSYYEIELRGMEKYSSVPTYLLAFLESIETLNLKNLLEIDFLKFFSYCYCECDKMLIGQSLSQFGLSEGKINALMFLLLKYGVLQPQMFKALDGSEFIDDFILNFNILSKFENYEDAECELFTIGTEIKIVK